MGALIDAILDLQTDTLTVTRHLKGAFDTVTGAWAPGTASTLQIIACVQPATGMQRVVGGRDMRSDEQGQHTSDIRAVYTEALMHTRDITHEPDQIAFEGGTWIVTRVERWALNDEVYYRAMMTRETRGAS